MVTFFSVVGSIIAIIVGVAALYFTYYQIEMSRKHSRLSVKPHLNINYVSDSGKMCFELENNGIGPAIIKTYSILINGVRHDLIGIKNLSTIWNALKDLELNDEFIYLSSYEKDEALKIGYSKPILGIKNEYCDNEKVRLNFIEKVLFKIGFEIDYESFYGNEFTLTKKSFDEEIAKGIESGEIKPPISQPRKP